MKKQSIILILTVVLSMFSAMPLFAQDGDAGKEGERLQTPDKPAEVHAETVAKEVEAAREHGHHGHGDAEKIIESFGQARTSRGLNYLAGAALAVMHEQGQTATDPVGELLTRHYNATSPNVADSFTIGHQGAGECSLDFDTPAVLASMWDNAQSTFTSPPHWVEACGDGNLEVKPTVYSHYHVLYEDSTIDCYDLNTGNFGRTNGDGCDPLPDPAQEPRYLGPHKGNDFITIKLASGGGNLPFTVHSFANVSPEPIKFRYQKAGGQWFQWESLAGNTLWNVAAFVTDVVEVQITHTGNSEACGPDWEAGGPGSCPVDKTPFFVDDFSISP